MKSLLMAGIRLYQLCFRAWMGPCCRFYPSCSDYGLEALRVHGACKGTWLIAKRILRCHPWHPGGYDPVPPRCRHPQQEDVGSNSTPRKHP